MKKILNIALATAFAFTLSGCNDFLDTSSSSVVDRDFVFSNEDSARDALYYGYETLRANRSLHSTGFFGIRYGVRILKIPKILIMKVVQVFFRNGFIPEEQAIIILIQVKVQKYSPNFMKQSQ